MTAPEIAYRLGQFLGVVCIGLVLWGALALLVIGTIRVGRWFRRRRWLR